MTPPITSGMDKTVLEASIKKKLHEKCISAIPNIEGKQSLTKGENYCSVIGSYKLEIVLVTGEKCTRNIIVKQMPPSQEKTKFFHEFSFFKNEINMYSKVIRLMNRLMEEFEDRRERLWCEMISYSPYDMIIFEDLKDTNFQMLNRKENLGFEHSMLVMNTLGRFHAMSKVLLNRGTLYNNEFSQYLFTQPLIMNLSLMNGLTAFTEAVKKNWGEKWKHLPQLLEKTKGKVHEKISNLIKVDETRFNVINHGDCWTNNMLFKFVEGTKIPCQLKYIDFQLSHYNSYAWDLTYFLYNATRPDIRRARMIDLLETYQKSLSYNLKFFNYTENDVPTLENIIAEMDRIKLFGFLMLASIHVMTTADTTDAFDLEESIKNANKPGAGVNYDIYNDKFKKSIEEDVKTLIEERVIG